MLHPALVGPKFKVPCITCNTFIVMASAEEMQRAMLKF